MSDSYSKAPITEAVIEIRTAEDMKDELVERARKVIAKRYPKSERMTEFTLVVAAGAQPNSRLQGFKLTSEGGDFIAQTRRNGLAFSALAPYPGWATFTAEFKEVWSAWSKVVGRRQVGRVGVRFLNRIDIPLEDGSIVESDDYLNVGVKLPKSTMNGALGWQSAAVSVLEGTPFHLRMITGAVESPLIGHLSYSLDLDLFCEVDVPQSDDDIWALLADAKEVKNRVFEECITDRTRELIS